MTTVVVADDQALVRAGFRVLVTPPPTSRWWARRPTARRRWRSAVATEYVYGALRAGASGFLLKDTPPADVLAAVRLVARGGALLGPTVTRRLIEELAQRPQRSRRSSQELAVLTDREREVPAMVATGISNAEIAGRLYLSPATVKTHVSRLLTKLHARDRAQLDVLAYETGLAVPGSTGSG